MKLKVVVKNFKKIQKASLNIEGFTLISGLNSSGKTSLIKAIKAFLDNSTKDSQIRHGQEEMAIGMGITDEGSTPIRVTLKRKNQTVVYKVDDQPSLEKTGRLPFYRLCPQFPIRRVDYGDHSFYPNIVMQNKVPIFDDIPVYDLMSAMFAPVAKTSDRVSALQKESLGASRKLSESISTYETLERGVYAAKQELDTLLTQYPDITDKARRAKELVQLRSECSSLESDILSSQMVLDQVDYSTLFLENEEVLRSKIDLQDQVEEALNNQSVIADIVAKLAESEKRYAKINEFLSICDVSVLEEAFSNQTDIADCQSEIDDKNTRLSKLTEFLSEVNVSDLVESVSNNAELDSVTLELDSKETRLGKLNEFFSICDVALLSEAFSNQESILDLGTEILDLGNKLLQNQAEFNEVDSELKSMKVCPIKLAGYCPEVK